MTFEVPYEPAEWSEDSVFGDVRVSCGRQAEPNVVDPMEAKTSVPVSWNGTAEAADD